MKTLRHYREDINELLNFIKQSKGLQEISLTSKLKTALPEIFGDIISSDSESDDLEDAHNHGESTMPSKRRSTSVQKNHQKSVKDSDPNEIVTNYKSPRTRAKGLDKKKVATSYTPPHDRSSSAAINRKRRSSSESLEGSGRLIIDEDTPPTILETRSSSAAVNKKRKSSNESPLKGSGRLIIDDEGPPKILKTPKRTFGSLPNYSDQRKRNKKLSCDEYNLDFDSSDNTSKTKQTPAIVLRNIRRRGKGRHGLAWSSEEEDALYKGVRKYGKGKWAFILSENTDLLKARTVRDCYDKWRNIKNKGHLNDIRKRVEKSEDRQ